MRLATILGLRHDKWVSLACGNAGEVRPQYKRLSDEALEGVSEIVYFDQDGERRKRHIRPAEAAGTKSAPVKKSSRSRT